MWITNGQMNKLERAVDAMCGYFKEKGELQPEEVTTSVYEAYKVLAELKEKRVKDNARCAAYVARRRKDNPEYAGNKKKGTKKSL